MGGAKDWAVMILCHHCDHSHFIKILTTLSFHRQEKILVIHEIHRLWTLTFIMQYPSVCLHAGAYNSDLDFSGHIHFGKARSQHCD